MSATGTPPTSNPAAPAAPAVYGEHEALCRLIQLGQGRFTLALVEYDLPSKRAEVVSGLRARFPLLNLTEVALSPPPPDAPTPYGVLDQLREQVRDSSPGGAPDALVVMGLETLLPSDAAGAHAEDEIRRAIQPLNLGRNLLAEWFPCPTLFFLPKAAMETLLTSAPDFVSWKSGFFAFESDAGGLRAEIEREAAAKIDWWERRRLRRRPHEWLAREAERLAALLADARALPAARSAVARLHQRLGWTAAAMNDGPAARRFFAEALRLARLENDAVLLGAAEKGLRAARRLRRSRPSPKRAAVLRRFRGAAPLCEADGLLGREADLQDLLLQVTRVGNRFVTVWGETGCGKTSLVLAGVVPELERRGHLPVVAREWGHPAAALHGAIEEECGVSLPPSAALRDWLRAAARKAEPRTILVVCDQFEQFFAKHPRRREREPLLKEIGDCLNDFRLPCKFIFILREDHLGRMVELERHVGDALDKNKRFYLPLFDQAAALRVMRQLAARAQADWPDAFLGHVVNELTRDGQVRPIEVQLVAAALFTLDINDEQAYSRAGRAEGLLTDYLQATLASVSEGRREQEDMGRVLLTLIGEPPGRLSLTAEEVAERSGVRPPARLRVALEKLEGANLVRRHAGPESPPPETGGGDRYELMHDTLIDPVLRLTRDIQDQRRRARRVMLRALEDARARPRHTVGLRKWLLLKRHLPARAKAAPKVKALLKRSLLVGMAKWLSLIFATLALALGAASNLPARLTVEHDYAGRVMINRGLPGLWFLPLGGGDRLIDTGFDITDLNNGAAGALQNNFYWEAGNHRGGVLRDELFHESLNSGFERGRLLLQVGSKERGLELILAPIKEINSKGWSNEDSLLLARLRAELVTAMRADPSLARPAFDKLFATFAGLTDRLLRNSIPDLLEDVFKADPSLARPAFDASFRLYKESINTDVKSDSATIMRGAVKADPALGRSEFETLLGLLKENKDGTTGYDMAAAVASVIEADPSFARQDVFDTLLGLFKETSFARSAVAYALTASVKANRSFAGPAFKAMLPTLERGESAYARSNASDIMAAAAKADPSLAKPLSDALFSTKGKGEAPAGFSTVPALAAVVEADASLVRPTLDALLTALKESEDSATHQWAVSGLAAIAATHGASLTQSDLSALLTVYREDEDAEARGSAALALRAAVEARRAESVGRVFGEMVNVLKRSDSSYLEITNYPTVHREDDANGRAAAAHIIAAAVEADKQLARPALHALLTSLEKDKEALVRHKAAEALAVAVKVGRTEADDVCRKLPAVLNAEYDGGARVAAMAVLETCIAANSSADHATLGLLTDYNADVRRGAVNGFARRLASLARLEVSDHERDPVQFLFDHLEGEQSLLPQGNANTHAVYRQAAARAMAWWLVSKKPEAVATQSELRRRLEAMRDRDPRLYLRVAAWQALAAAADLRDKQAAGGSEDFDR